MSPDSRERDHAEKPRVYARARIPRYWIVDQESGKAVVHQYGLTPTAEGDQYTLIRSVALADLDAG